MARRFNSLRSVSRGDGGAESVATDASSSVSSVPADEDGADTVGRVRAAASMGSAKAGDDASTWFSSKCSNKPCC
jgi:hypothetical protein